jgi:hypothetical protein
MRHTQSQAFRQHLPALQAPATLSEHLPALQAPATFSEHLLALQAPATFSEHLPALQAPATLSEHLPALQAAGPQPGAIYYILFWADSTSSKKTNRAIPNATRKDKSCRPQCHSPQQKDKSYRPQCHYGAAGKAACRQDGAKWGKMPIFLDISEL